MATEPFTLVYVNYQSARSLSLALASLYASENKASVRVIVVNNDPSEKALLEALSEELHFHLIESGSNIGFGAGANRGAHEATTALLGFINPDTLWQEPFLERLRDRFQIAQASLIFGLTLVDAQGRTERHSSGMAPSLKRLLQKNLLSFMPASLRNRTEPLEWTSGGGLFVARATFLDLGGFDTDYFLYFEDTDLCIRAKKRGIVVTKTPECRLFHKGGQSFSRPDVQKKYFYASQLTYFQKHRPRSEYLFLRFLHRCLGNI